MSLRKKTISGIFWSLLQNVGSKGLIFLITILLARLLTPQAFGLIGMLTILIQISQALVSAGFNQALIQKKDADADDFSSVFWINLTVSLILYVLLFILAPFISDFFKQPPLTDLCRVLSLIFVIDSFSYVQEARFTKNMRFKLLTIIHIPSTVVGGIVSVIMALMGFGVWSLIALQLVTRLAYAIQIWIYSRWRPEFLFKLAKIKKLFSFGGKLMVSAIINAVYQNIYLVVIGRYFPLTSVGYYQNAFNIARTPSSTFSGALSKVLFPAFSIIQDDNRRLKAGFKKVMQQVLFWLCPAFIIAGVMADPLFHVVFTEKWVPAVPYFQILCVVGILAPLNIYNLNILNVKGRSDLYLKLEILKKVVTTIGIILSLSYNIYVLLIFQSANSIFAYIVNSYYSGKFIQYPLVEQISDILPILLLSLGIGVLLYFLSEYLFPANHFYKLSLGFLVGGGLYIFIAKVIRIQPYMDLVEILRSKVRSKQ